MKKKRKKRNKTSIITSLSNSFPWGKSKKRKKHHPKSKKTMKRHSTKPTKKRLLEEKKKKRQRKKRLQLLQDLLLAIAGASVLIPLGVSFFIQFSTITGYGMSPTLRNDDVVIVNKTKELKRFDLVLFKKGNTTQIRRVIGLPGEIIEYGEDHLYVDGQKIDEKFIVDEVNESQRNGMNFTEDFTIVDMISQQMIPKGKYLLLGDNRSYATDSRHYGLVDVQMIVGVVKMKVLPLEDFQVY